MREGFEATIVQDDRGVVVRLSGTVDRSAKDGLEGAYTEASKSGGRVVFDFNDVEYINSTGIAVIVGVLAKARAEARTVGAFGLSDHYREVFNITRLADFMTIYEDETAATMG